MTGSRQPKPSISPVSRKTFAQVADWIRRSRQNVPFLLGIGGPGGCGKTTLSQWLLTHFPESALLSLDNFRLPRKQREARGIFGSHPEGSDLPRLRDALQSAREGKCFATPVYNSASGESTDTVLIPACQILLCDGEIAAHSKMRVEFDGLILVDAHWRTQLDTRLSRDLQERNSSVEKALEVFIQSNLRDYPKYAAGALEAADCVLYRNRRNDFRLTKLRER